MTTLHAGMLNIDFVQRARWSDPLTSHRAAEKSRIFASGHARRILDALKLHGPRAACELEQLIGLSVAQIDRRTTEIQRAGLIEVVQENGQDKTVAGCRVWRAV